MAATTPKKPEPKKTTAQAPAIQASPLPEPPQRIKRRRSLDEMTAALTALVSGKVPQRDDEWGQVLQDAIAEVIESRRILMQADQEFSAAHTNLVNSVKMMGQ